MCEMRVAALVSVLASLLLLAALPASASAGLAGFQYQREIAIQENSGETLRDYQVLVELSGSDFPEEAEADGDDIRFTDADGRELSYWVEEFDAGSEHARIWVKVPRIPANDDAMVTMWYGNPGAESGSDGDEVFEFFDDFEDGDYNGWTVEEGSWTIIDGTLRGTSKHAKISAGENLGSGNIFETRMRVSTDGDNAADFYFGFQDINNWYQTEVWLYKGDSFYITKNYGGVRIRGEKVEEAIGTDWQDISIIWTDDVIKGYRNNALKITITTDLTSTRGGVGFGVNFANIGYFDYIRVRKFASSEPIITFGQYRFSAISIEKSPLPFSIRQFQETTITISIENSGTTDATDIEITDTIHPSFDLVSGDFPNPKRYELIRPGETRDLQYVITAKESGTFTLDPATVTYADEDGNIQEAKSEPASIKVIPSTGGSTSGGTPRNPSVSTASVQLHGEKTSVVLGEDILLKLSAVNLITKPTMHVQVIIIPPSGMSVTSSAFAKSGAGQYTTTYELEPGTGKDIEVAIRSNQVGDFDVNGRIIYYFGDDREDAEDHTLTLPITVRAEPEQTVDTSGSEENGSSTPGFVAVVAIIGLLAAYLRRRI